MCCDAAIKTGRIEASAREAFVRAYEHAPDLVVSTLAAAEPDVNRAGRNLAATMTAEEDAAYRADFARRAFIEPAQVL